MLRNPFTTFGYESTEYFCDRESETHQLISQLINGNHVALISPRRMGKTGLIHHCFAQPKNKRRLLYISYRYICHKKSK